MNILNQARALLLAQEPDLRATLNLYRQLRALRLDMEKETEAVASLEKGLRDTLINNIEKSGDGVVADGYAAKIVTKTKPTVPADKWQEFFGYVQRTGRFDLLQKRLSDKAVMDTLEREDIPGVEKLHVSDVSITKL